MHIDVKNVIHNHIEICWTRLFPKVINVDVSSFFFFTFLITPGVFLSLDTLANSSSFNTDDFLNFFTNKIDLIRDLKNPQKNGRHSSQNDGYELSNTLRDAGPDHLGLYQPCNCCKSHIQDGQSRTQQHSLGPPVKQLVQTPSTAVHSQQTVDTMGGLSDGDALWQCQLGKLGQGTDAKSTSSIRQ